MKIFKATLSIILIAVLGFLTYKYVIKSNNTITEEKTNVNTLEDIKKDKSKDYICFDNYDVVSVEEQIIYKDIYININTDEALQISNKLNEETKKLKNTVVKSSDSMCSDEVKSATNREYEVKKYDNYLSLLATDTNFVCGSESSKSTYNYYVFDLKSGKVLNKTEILNSFELNESRLVNKITSDLNKKITELGSHDESLSDFIKKDETLNDLDYYIYIDEDGSLVVKYRVKTTKDDYYEILNITK